RNFQSYQGTANGLNASFSLCWLTSDSVVGTMVRDSDYFTLAGSTTRDGALFMSIAFKGRMVAHLKVRSRDDTNDTWQGSMLVTETGDILPVEFHRGSAYFHSGPAITSVTFTNNTKNVVSIAIAYLDSKLKSWISKGYWSIKPAQAV